MMVAKDYEEAQKPRQWVSRPCHWGDHEGCVRAWHGYAFFPWHRRFLTEEQERARCACRCHGG